MQSNFIMNIKEYSFSDLVDIIEFEEILRSFYNTSHSTFSSKLDFDKVILFENCIHDEEKKILHVSIH